MGIESFFAKHILDRLPGPVARRVRRAYYARVIRTYGETRIPEFRIIRELVRPGDFVLDVGANIGVFTKHLSLRVGDRGRVWSIEPVPRTFDVLRSNVRKLRLDNVKLIPCAISDADGSVTMEIPRFETIGENFYRARVVQAPTDRLLRRVTVESRTLDSLLSDGMADVSFIKCDVEGHELSCVKGATRVIETAHPAWFLEVSGDPDERGSNAWQTVKLLSEAGYAVFWLDGATLVQRRGGDRSTNYFFLTPDHVRRMQARKLMSANVGGG